MTFHAVQRSYESIDVAADEYLEPLDSSLLHLFKHQFHTLSADTPEHIRTAHQVRYQVYCVENGYEDPDKPDRLETDEFDSHAVQSLLRCRLSFKALGTVRLILPREDSLHDSFAVQRVLDAKARSEFDKLPVWTMGEVSRFSISRQARRPSDVSGPPSQVVANSGPLMRLGLIQGLIRLSIENGITHWCAAMEPTLLRMLAAMAIRFKPLGPVVNYHGMRQPCYCAIADVLSAVRRERPTFWTVLTDGGTLTY